MYDSHGLELCTIYDSHDVYLRVLWTICMYKFSTCHVVIFTGFSFHLLIFDKNHPVSGKIRPEIAMPIFRKNHRFIGEIGRLIAKTGQISVFLISIVPPSSLLRFGRIFPYFTDFSKNRWNRPGPIFLLPSNFRTLAISLFFTSSSTFYFIIILFLS
jgi:hypothetical protein